MIYPPPSATPAQTCYLVGWDASLSTHILLTELKHAVEEKEYLEGPEIIEGEIADIINDTQGYPECFLPRDKSTIQRIGDIAYKQAEILENRENEYFNNGGIYPYPIQDEDLTILKEIWNNISEIVYQIWNTKQT